MDTLKPLIDEKEIKTEFITRVVKENTQSGQVHYDQRLDTMVILYVPQETPTFVYYVNDGLALVCDLETKEVVGFHVEAFTRNFVPQQTNQQLIRSHAPFRVPEMA